MSDGNIESYPNYHKIADSDDASHLSALEVYEIPTFSPSQEVQALISTDASKEAKDKYLFTTLDILRQKVEWIMPRLNSISKAVKKTNGTCIQLKHWKDCVEDDLDRTIKFTREHKLELIKSEDKKAFLKSIIVFLSGTIGGLLAAFSTFSGLFDVIAK